MNYRLLSLLFLIFFSFSAHASNVSHSKQVFLVLTPEWNAVEGKLQRFQRDNDHHIWVKVGEAIPVVVGSNGMAWGADFNKYTKLKGPMKQEGDRRTPMGIFKIGPEFGFEERPYEPEKIPYMQLRESSICVDDPLSRYYNQILDNDYIATPDWTSAEMMRQVDAYRLGGVIQYNTSAVPNAGSCIFLHIWQDPKKGTAGCVAMAEPELKQVLSWLDSSQEPVIALFTQEAFMKSAFAKGF